MMNACQSRERCLLMMIALLFVVPRVGLSDLIRLKSGGEIRGKVEGRVVTSRLPEVTIVTLTGAHVTIRREALDFVTPRSLSHEEYEVRAASIPDTVEAHWELAEWCRENRLSRQRSEQLEQVIRLDPNHEPAHRGLGHSLRNGAWMTRDELMTSRGYVLHKGRYVTPQELDLLEKSEQELKAEQVWFPRVRLWLTWAVEGDADRRSQGLRNLYAIRDADAVAALETNLAEHESRDVRMAFVAILKSLAGSKPVRPLVRRSLEDQDAGVRRAAVSALQPDQHNEAMEIYVRALRHEQNVFIRRSAEALGTIGTSAVIDPLIEALVTSHQQTIAVRDPGISMISGGGNVGTSYGTLAGGALPPDVEAGLRTGQYPYGAIVLTPPIMNRTKTLKLRREIENREVRRALQSLTGQDFGYDKRSWSLWWTAHQNEAGTKLPSFESPQVP